MENTLVDESQRQSKEYGSASKPRHEKYSGMIIGGMVCHVSLLHLLLRCTAPLWANFVDCSDASLLIRHYKSCMMESNSGVGYYHLIYFLVAYIDKVAVSQQNIRQIGWLWFVDD